MCVCCLHSITPVLLQLNLVCGPVAVVGVRVIVSACGAHQEGHRDEQEGTEAEDLTEQVLMKEEVNHL